MATARSEVLQVGSDLDPAHTSRSHVADSCPRGSWANSRTSARRPTSFRAPTASELFLRERGEGRATGHGHQHDTETDRVPWVVLGSP
jgi:hypothetical protein